MSKDEKTYVIFRSDSGQTLKTITGGNETALTAKKFANMLNTRIGVCEVSQPIYFSPTKEKA